MADRKLRLKYHCVEVIAGAGACEVARSLKDLRLLSAEAPLLPLKTCDRPADCKCIYRHFEDRRKGPRRQNEQARVSYAYKGTERRKRHGRRETDYE